jgi:uncharacterized membrane protein YeaQ/YmgE (transglycosylase-associated protein family)
MISWLIYGLFVGLIVRFLYPGSKPSGCLPTILIGVLGSYVGGTLHYAFGFGKSGEFFQPSGVLFGIIGGLVLLLVWNYVKTKMI